MGKKSKKGVSRAGVKQHPGAGQSKTRGKSTTGKSVGSSASVMSQDSLSIASADMVMKSSTLGAMAAAAGSGPNGPLPLDVLNFVNTLMMQQQQQQQQQQHQAEAAAAAPSSDPSLGNKENTATTATLSSEPGAPELAAAADSSRQTNPMIVTLDQSMEEAAMAALIVGKLEEASQRRSGVDATLETAPPPTTDPIVVVSAVDNGVVAPAVESAPPAKEMEDIASEVASLEVVNTESPPPGLSVVEPEITDPEKNVMAVLSACESKDDTVVRNDDKVDVWSSNLRDVVVTSSPSLKEKPVIDVTPYKPKAIPTDTDVVMTLDKPSPREMDAQKQDCGCVIS
jgi:hypothetical protein